MLLEYTVEAFTLILIVQVHAEDYSKLNEVAEAAWIVRDPENAYIIRQLRSDLLRTVGRKRKTKLDCCKC